MLNTLRSIVQDVAGAGSFREQLDLLVHDVRVALGTEVCSIYLMNRVQDHLLFAANEGLNTESVGQISLSIEQGLVGLVAERAEPINLNNATVHPRFHLVPEIGEEAFHAFLGVPVIHHRQVLGVVVVQQRERRKFDESEEAFLVTLSAQLATVIAHADATGDMEQLFVDDTAPALERADAMFHGVGGIPGISMGTAVLIHPPATLEAVTDKIVEDVSTELQVLDRAIEAVREDIRRISEQFSASLPPEELALFDVYLHMLDDNALAGDIRDRVRKGSWAQGALKQVIHEHLRLFEAVEDPYIRERGTDIKDLGLRVLAYLQDIRAKKTHFPEDTILVGEEVTPGMMAEVPAGRLRGIVSVRGSVTSHLAIMAQSLDIPAIMGAVDLPVANIDNAPLVVDGFYGEVICNPSPGTVEHYQTLMAGERELAHDLEALKDFKGVTLDGWRVGLWVNIGLTGVGRSLDRGAEGIGLFRTEIPFMTKERFPSEEDQRAIYREHMEAFEPKPVTMRTLHIGGDKALSYFPITEENPFLGWRGIRVTLDHPEIFMVQTRAMLKANEGLEGELRIMLPMVTSITEVEEAMALIERAHTEVLEEGFDVKQPQIGVMVEVPSAVYQARRLAGMVDFLAVGSNDLTQYMLAVDRNNPQVADLYQETHPAVLAALQEVAKAAVAENSYLGICGELAGTPIGAVLLMAMGYQVLSMNETNLPKVKWIIRNIKRSDARRMLARVLRMDTPEEVQAYMRRQLIDAGLGRVLPTHHH
jgi:phosphotransferase system enzyme I (PtsP)